MSLILIPASRENLEKSIEKSVDLSLARAHLPAEFIENILQYTGIEGIRCWASTKNRKYIYDDLQNTDEILLTEKGTGLFTHYGIVVGKIQDVGFGNALWPVVGENPWEYIYFLGNITRVNIPKSALVKELGYAGNFTVPGAIRVDNALYKNIDTISKRFEIPVSDNIAEINEDKDFSAENIQSIGSRREGHTKFSKTVKNNYNQRCSICGLEGSHFLVAGHISPWAEDPANRLNPQNGICFCTFHDRAFEKGYIGIDDNYKIIINPRIDPQSALHTILKQCSGVIIHYRSGRNAPDKNLLKKHREKHKFD